MKIEVTLPQAKDPAAFGQAIERALDRAAQETAREMQRAAPKAHSTLWASIQAWRDGEYQRMVAPTVNYAAAVEQGTGPAVGKERYFPPPQALESWVKLRARITFSARKGTHLRKRQENEVRDRAQALARFIYEHGTQPHPFVAPTAEKMQPRILQLLAGGVREGLGGSA